MILTDTGALVALSDDDDADYTACTNGTDLRILLSVEIAKTQWTPAFVLYRKLRNPTDVYR